jgi:hypothetical protein
MLEEEREVHIEGFRNRRIRMYFTSWAKDSYRSSRSAKRISSIDRNLAL